MADAKITQLTELTTADGADLTVVVDDVAGTPTTKKITLTNIAAWLASLTQTLTNKTLTSPVINTPTGDVVTLTGTQTLTNKTHTAPILNTPVISNPYKFSAYLTVATNTINGDLIIPFNAEVYDTNSNFDITTNKGRYTVPVNGYYQFNAVIAHNGNIRTVIMLFVNGSSTIRGNDLVGSGGNLTVVVSALLYLTAGQYVEVNIYTPSATALNVGSALCAFQGFLVSQS